MLEPLKPLGANILFNPLCQMGPGGSLVPINSGHTVIMIKKEQEEEKKVLPPPFLLPFLPLYTYMQKGG